jgi:hypothetical protein
VDDDDDDDVRAPCERCGVSTQLFLLQSHEQHCTGAAPSVAVRQRAAPAPPTSRRQHDASGGAGERDAACPWCGAFFTAPALAQHGPRCASLPARFASGALPLALAGAHAADGARLTSAQTAALEHVATRAARASADALPALTKRVQALGYKAVELHACLAFIRDRAPLVVHFAADRALHLLAADTHYRNQFETRTSGGTLDANARCAACAACCRRLPAA